MDRTCTTAPTAPPATPGPDWTAFLEVYADLIDDLDVVTDDPAPAHPARVPDRAPQGSGTPSRGPMVERPRPLALAR